MLFIAWLLTMLNNTLMMDHMLQPINLVLLSLFLLYLIVILKTLAFLRHNKFAEMVVITQNLQSLKPIHQINTIWSIYTHVMNIVWHKLKIGIDTITKLQAIGEFNNKSTKILMQITGIIQWIVLCILFYSLNPMELRHSY